MKKPGAGAAQVPGAAGAEVVAEVVAGHQGAGHAAPAPRPGGVGEEHAVHQRQLPAEGEREPEPAQQREADLLLQEHVRRPGERVVVVAAQRRAPAEVEELRVAPEAGLPLHARGQQQLRQRRGVAAHLRQQRAVVAGPRAEVARVPGRQRQARAAAAAEPSPGDVVVHERHEVGHQVGVHDLAVAQQVVERPPHQDRGPRGG